jgi:hypothetical protein
MRDPLLGPQPGDRVKIVIGMPCSSHEIGLEWPLRIAASCGIPARMLEDISCGQDCECPAWRSMCSHNKAKEVPPC